MGIMPGGGLGKGLTEIQPPQTFPPPTPGLPSQV